MIFFKNAKSFKFCNKKSTELLKLSAFVISKFSQHKFFDLVKEFSSVVCVCYELDRI